MKGHGHPAVTTSPDQHTLHLLQAEHPRPTPTRIRWRGLPCCWRNNAVALFALALILLLNVPATAATEPEAKRLSLSRQIRHHLAKPPAQSTNHVAFTRPANWIFIPEAPATSQVTGVAVGGDFNGDGLADVAIGDAKFGEGRGRVLVFYGSPGGLPARPDLILEGDTGECAFGSRLQMMGDLDGDGFDDVLIAAQTSAAGASVGHIFHGGANGLNAKPAWLAPVHAVPIGDVNGDGCDDVAAKAQDPVHETSVQVFYGSPNGPSPGPVWTAHSEQRGSGFGDKAIASAGDVNGDGYDDLLVGAMRFSGRLHNSGKVYLYLGSAQGLSAKPAWTAEYPLPTRKEVDEAYEQFFGWGLASAGDVNHDGFDDVIVGACFADHGDLNEGLAFVYHGSRQGLSQSPDWWAESNHQHALFATSVAPAGDVNGDGVDDIVIGLPEATDGQRVEGAAAVYHGSKTGLALQPAWLMESEHTNERFGSVVAGAGDLNGDGYADVLILGPEYLHQENGSQLKCGRVVVAYGGPGGLLFSNSWSLEKPWLTALQQELDHYHLRFGSIVYWGPWLLVLSAVTTGFLVLQSRLRRRLALALEKNRQLILAQERTRLARDLHDELGGHLARLSQSGEAPGTSLAEAARGVATGIERTIWSLHPERCSPADLACGLTDLAENLLRDTSIRSRFDIPLELPATELPAETLDALYRATQEALNNVRKHSHASEVTITLHCAGTELEVSIADDGVGLPAGTSVAYSGHGMNNMAARLREVGGSRTLSPNSPHGLVVRLVVPWRR